MRVRPDDVYLNEPGPDVVVRRERAEKFPIEVVKVNVPWTVVWHSPDGFECGYGGSGPADLALNILQQFLPGREVECYGKTKCSHLAARFHQDFKTDFIAGMPTSGARIPAIQIKQWILDHLGPVKGELLRGDLIIERPDWLVIG